MKTHIHLAAMTFAALTLAACSKAPKPTAQPSTAVVAAEATQQGTPPCGPCEAGYVGLQTTGLANYSIVKVTEFRYPLVVASTTANQAMGADHGKPRAISVTGDWWTAGGSLHVSADSGTPAVSWNPIGARKDRDTPPAEGVEIPAGWYYSYVTCATARCENVAITVDGKPVVPYYMPPRHQ